MVRAGAVGAGVAVGAAVVAGAVWAMAVPPSPAAMTSVITLQSGARKRAAMAAGARRSVIIIRETIGGWRWLK